MKIVVIGGTGLIGSKVVARLTEHGHEAVPASPRLGINTITGEGLAAASTARRSSSTFRTRRTFEYATALEFFGTSTRNLLAAEAAAGVGHHVALSVVGTEDLSESGDLATTIAGYFRAKTRPGGADRRRRRSRTPSSTRPSSSSSSRRSPTRPPDVARSVCHRCCSSPWRRTTSRRAWVGSPSARRRTASSRSAGRSSSGSTSSSGVSSPPGDDPRDVVTDPAAATSASPSASARSSPANGRDARRDPPRGLGYRETVHRSGDNSRFVKRTEGAHDARYYKEPVGFETNIRPLFRERDRDSMEFAFDLWSLDDVSENADADRSVCSKTGTNALRRRVARGTGRAFRALGRKRQTGLTASKTQSPAQTPTDSNSSGTSMRMSSAATSVANSSSISPVTLAASPVLSESPSSDSRPSITYR